MNVVFDTQIFLRALINPESVCGRIAFHWDQYYTLYVADQIEEILDVLSRPKLRQRFEQITDERVNLIKGRLKRGQRIKVSSTDIEPICRDPKDDIFLACAKIARVDYLVSEDNDLLVLKQHDTIQIINALAFIKILEVTSDT